MMTIATPGDGMMMALVVYGATLHMLHQAFTDCIVEIVLDGLDSHRTNEREWSGWRVACGSCGFAREHRSSDRIWAKAW